MKKTLSILMFVLVLCLAGSAWAASSGSCGEQASWTLDDQGLLTITGSGTIEYGGWVSYQVTKVQLDAGITGIAESAFFSCYYLEELSLPDQLQEVGEFAFGSDLKLLTGIGTTTAKTLGKQGFSFYMPGSGCFLRYDTLENGTVSLALARIEDSVTTLTVPEGVERIAAMACSSKSNLTKVTLPESVHAIGIAAFAWCDNLREIVLPAHISEIETDAFLQYGGGFELDRNTETAKALGKIGYTFHEPGKAYELMYAYDSEGKERGLALAAVPEGTKSFTVPAGIQVLKADAFRDNTKLKTLKLPDSLREIESYAFTRCNALKKLTLPPDIEEIGYGAFYDTPTVCYSDIGTKTAIALGRIGVSFRDTKSDLQLEYAEGKENQLTLMGGVSKKATSLKVPEGVNTIKADPYFEPVFDGCTSLGVVELPKSISSLDPASFMGLERTFYIKCKSGSYAEKFALAYGFQYDNGKKQVIGCNITNTEQKVNWIVSNYIRSGMSEREKVRVLHNWLVYNAQYDYTYSNYSADGVLIRGTGVCDSYSKACELLLTRAGLANRRLVGKSNNGSGKGWEGHAWNLVRVDGQWYHLDTTWDDPKPSWISHVTAIAGIEHYTYFLISDSKIKGDHMWAEGISADNNQVGSYHDNGVAYHYASEGNYQIDTASGKATLVKGNLKAKTVKIPDTVTENGKTYKVTAIGAEVFKGSKKLTKLTLGKHVQTIGESAFASCTKLKTITGGKGLVTLKASAFQGCKALTKITLESKVKTLGKNAFNGCAKLKTITVKTKKLTTKTLGANAFKGIYKKATFKVPKAKLKAYKSLVTKKGAPKTVKVK